ncbi:MAG: hypothetical protein M1118_15050 [Chloroflexi bacterium]|nr:hypothetical protein [Chloroflexota bacterium]
MPGIVFTDVVAVIVLLLPALMLIVLVLTTVLPWFSKSWREAEARAETLVRSLLTQEEYERLQRTGYLDVASPNFPQRVYRIPCGMGTVSVLESGRCVDRLCVYSTQPIPERETVVVHKLMIEGNEHDYLRQANHLPC